MREVNRSVCNVEGVACLARICIGHGDLRFLVAPGLSAGDLVLTREPAEDLFSADPVLGEVNLSWPGVSLSGRELAQGAVPPGGAVMLQVFVQHPAQMGKYSEVL